METSLWSGMMKRMGPKISSCTICAVGLGDRQTAGELKCPSRKVLVWVCIPVVSDAAASSIDAEILAGKRSKSCTWTKRVTEYGMFACF